MKKAFILFIFSLLGFNVLSKQTTIDSLKNRLTKIETFNKQFLLKNDSLLLANANLSKEIDYKENLLNQYNTLNSSTYNIVYLLFGFFGLIVPILGYVFIFKPANETTKEAQKVLDDIKNNMEELFSVYLKTNRNKLIDNAIEGLENSQSPETNSYLNILHYEKSGGFNPSQIFRIMEIINKGIYLDNKLNAGLLLSLTGEENKIVESFFLTKLREGISIYYPVMMYFAKYNKTEYFSDITAFIIKKNNLLEVSNSLLDQYRAFVFELYNYEGLANAISGVELNRFLVGFMKQYPMTPIVHTKLYKKFNANNPLT